LLVSLARRLAALCFPLALVALRYKKERARDAGRNGGFLKRRTTHDAETQHLQAFCDGDAARFRLTVTEV
jgi:hypothetical protein